MGDGAQAVPFDVASEQAILGSFFVDAGAIAEARALIGPDVFYDSMHRDLCALIFEFAAEERAVTPLTIYAWAKHLPALQEVGGVGYLAGLMQAAPAMPSIRLLCTNLRDLATRRALLAAAQAIAENAARGPAEMAANVQVEEAAAAISAVMEEATADDGSTGAGDAGQILLSEVESQIRDGRRVGCPTGITPLDEIIGSLLPGNLAILAGRPGMGKTMAATNIARHAAAVGWSVDYWSIEMPARQLSARLQADLDYERSVDEGRGPIEYSRIVQGRPRDGDLGFAAEANIRLQGLPIHVIDRDNVTASRIMAVSGARARRVQKRKLVIIDHGGLVEPEGRYLGRKVDEVSQQTKLYKRMAKSIGIPVLVLWQLSRDVETRDDKRPVLRDLRDSGSIEQDADVVIFAYRPAYYAQAEVRRAKGEDQVLRAEAAAERAVGAFEFIVEKNRNGRTGTANCWVEPVCGSIRDERPVPRSIRDGRQAALDLLR